MGQRYCDRLVLRLRRKHHRLGSLQLLEGRQGSHPVLHDCQHDRVDVLSFPCIFDGKHVR